MRHTLAVVVCLVGASVVMAEQGGIYLSPTILVLEHNSPVSVVVVRNDTDRETRFQARGFAWSNSPDASIQLELTDDLVVYPTAISLQPGETRRVRVGSRVPGERVERAFRLILDEVPLPGAPSAAVGLTTRMQFSLPVFLETRDRSMQVTMPTPDVVAGAVRVSLRNTGPRHVTPQRVDIRGIQADGTTLWTRSFKPWYLLAGESRRFEAPLTAAECLATERVVAEAAFAEGPKLALREERQWASAPCLGP